MPTIDERELEDYLMASMDNLNHIGVGLTSYAQVHRQFHLGGYGRPDIICIDPYVGPEGVHFFDVTVIELKKGELDVSALMQAYRYVAGLKRHLNQLNAGSPCHFEFRVVLVGGSINPSDWVFLGHSGARFSAYTYKISLDHGVWFEEADLIGFHPTRAEMNQGFSESLALWKTQSLDLMSEMEDIRKAQSLALPPAPDHVEAEPVHG